MNKESYFIDTHCHMNMMVDKNFESRLRDEHFALITQIVARAEQAGVKKIVNVGTSLIETENSLAIAQRHKNVRASAGIHPCDAKQDWFTDFKTIRDYCKRSDELKIVAVGETGLDFYHKPFEKQRQIDCFRAHIELSIECGLPLVIHIRESADEVLRVVDDYHADVRATFHCFMQEQYVADKAIEWGFMLGIDGPITYPKNESFRKVVAQLPLDHLIFETDAPFLPPQHMRGKQNGPHHLPSFAQTVADLKSLTLEQLACATSKNAEWLFRF